MFEIIISDEEKSQWRNGDEVFWKMPKDNRPDMNIYQYDAFDDNDQGLYKLKELAHRYPVNKTPVEIEKVIEQAEKISKIYHDFMRHALAVCLDPNDEIIK